MLLYVIDGLEPGEREMVQRLLDAGDADAERAYAEAAETLSSLPMALEQEEPSAELRAALLRRAVGRDAENTSLAIVRSSTAADAMRPQPAVGAWPKLAIAAAFVLGVGLTAVVMLQMLGPNDTQQQTAGEGWADIEQVVAEQKRALQQQRDELAELQERLAAVRGDEQIDALQELIDQQRLAIAQQQQRIGELQESVSLLVGPGVQQAELAGGEQVPDAQGRLMWDPTTGQMRLLTRGLPALKPGETYQLWFVTKDGEPVSLGVFGVNEVAQTTAAYVNTVPLVPSNVNVAAISIEPEGGSPEPGPTGPIIMTGPPKNDE
jgi:anti-sigma-K factor RskA